MRKPEIIASLKRNHHSFTAYIDGLSDEEFLFTHSGKWTAGQQLRHIYLAVRPVVLAFSLPRILIGSLFGKARTQGRSYDDLVAAYVSRLQSGAKASLPYIPKTVHPKEKEALIAMLNAKVESLGAKIDKSTEQELDSLRLPHPILGKLTMREMLFFTIYHVKHHHKSVMSIHARA